MTTENILQKTAAALGEDEGQSYVGLRERVRSLIDQLLAALFPRHVASNLPADRLSRLEIAHATLRGMLASTLPAEEAGHYADRMIAEIPSVMELLRTDILAAYQGDPAARNTDEVILCYPAFTAISIYRLANLLFRMGVPLLPRMMTEYAHERTGIDIHPGATIGPYFFIDHGTGVVIGETTTIGEPVTPYQHVTLGAKTLEVGDDGLLVKGIKRHPDIGNHVVIYAGATILGGNTVIGDHCTIGGNVWLTHSVPAGQTVVTRPSVEVKGV